MSDSERKPMRRFEDLDSREQAEIIKQVQREIANLLGERLHAAPGLDRTAWAQTLEQTHSRYGWAAN